MSLLGALERSLEAAQLPPECEAASSYARRLAAICDSLDDAWRTPEGVLDNVTPALYLRTLQGLGLVAPIEAKPQRGSGRLAELRRQRAAG